MMPLFPEITAAVSRKDVELLACLVRKYFGGTGSASPKINCRAIFEQSGIRVELAQIEPLAMLVVRDQNGRVEAKVIVRREEGSQPEQSFLLAHLMGHLLFHVQPQIARGEWQSSGVKESMSPLERYSLGAIDTRTPKLDLGRETLADEFASALIMPLGMVRKAAEKLGDIDKIAALFAMPGMVVRRRLEKVGVLVDVPGNFLDAEARLGLGRAAATDPGLSAVIGEGRQPITISQPEGIEKINRVLARSSYTQAGAMAGAPGGGAEGAEDNAAANGEASRLAPIPMGHLKTSPSPLDRIRTIARRIDPGVS